jgi:hypothetical protein
MYKTVGSPSLFRSLPSCSALPRYVPEQLVVPTEPFMSRQTGQFRGGAGSRGAGRAQFVSVCSELIGGGGPPLCFGTGPYKRSRVPGFQPRMRQAIERAWNDEGLRRRYADAGYEYAQRLGGEDDLRRNVLGALPGSPA